MTSSADAPCCAPGRGADSGTRVAAGRSKRSAGPMPELDLVEIPAGSSVMGNASDDAYPEDGEGPAHEVQLSEFRIGRCAVTNELFARFVDQTGYVTEAERFEWSFVFGGLLPDDFPRRARSRRRPGGGRCTARTGATGGARTPRSRDATGIPWCTSRGPTPASSAPGAARGFRPRRSGSTRREAASRAEPTRGGVSASRAASTG